MLAVLGVLRRPATAADHLDRSQLDRLNVEGLLVRYVRVVHAAGGLEYCILPSSDAEHFDYPPARCNPTRAASVSARV